MHAVSILTEYSVVDFGLGPKEEVRGGGEKKPKAFINKHRVLNHYYSVLSEVEEIDSVPSVPEKTDC
jgi:hypothetical protein